MIKTIRVYQEGGWCTVHKACVVNAARIPVQWPYVISVVISQDVCFPNVYIAYINCKHTDIHYQTCVGLSHKAWTLHFPAI